MARLLSMRSALASHDLHCTPGSQRLQGGHRLQLLSRTSAGRLAPFSMILKCISVL
ncbi:hypothetical protein DsansV1_C04g0041461 [Dioscorea sansibarensis]